MSRILLAVLLVLVLAPLPAQATARPAFPLELVKRVAITTDAEGGSARPELVATADRVFVLYLGNIVSGNNRTFGLKIYDRQLATVLASRVLVSTTLEYGGPTDIRVAADGQYLYAFYETNQRTSPSSSATYLWAAKYTLDDRFERVAYTTTPITNSRPLAELPEGGELLDDPAPLVSPQVVYVVTRIKHSLAMAGATVYRVRGFTRDTLTQISEFDLDLSIAADGRGRVASLLYSNNRILMVLATTVSDQGINENTDDGALADLVLVRMQPDWTFNPLRDVFLLSAELGDRENYVTDLKTDGRYLYVSYKQALGVPPTGLQVAVFKVFDAQLNLVYKQKVRYTVWGPDGGELRPSLELAGGLTLSGQSTGQSLGHGNAEIYVYAPYEGPSSTRSDGLVANR
jgi:hypothetical protein